MFCNKELIELANISRRTFFRRLDELKRLKKLIKQSGGTSYSIEEAQIIASYIGFTFKLEKAIIEKKKK